MSKCDKKRHNYAMPIEKYIVILYATNQRDELLDGRT